MSKRILILGALGQIGTELTTALQERYGQNQVIATDRREPPEYFSGTFESLDALNSEKLRELVERYDITEIYHMVAMLSATAEEHPLRGWDLNMQSLLSVLELAREKNIRVFWPSSIAAFGPNTPKQNTPQLSPMDPGTVYGISKLAGELWCQYYFEKYGVDVRSIRYPGIISYKTKPGGGTTDYAVEIFFEAHATGRYQCFLGAHTTLPMMYMSDAIKATLQLMEASGSQILVRSSYNVAAFSFSPAELALEIQKLLPHFAIDYAPDHRDKIAQGWPQSINDSAAREHWHWQPEYDLPAMVSDMLEHTRSEK